MFWQIRTGEIILNQGALPTADRFSSTHSGETNPPIYWLSQIFYAALVWEIGLTGLQAIDTLLFILALGLVANIARRVTFHPLVPSVALMLGFFVVMPHHRLRPATFGMLGFALIVFISSSYWRPRTKLLALMLTILLWQNLHASATVGILYLGLLFLAEAWRWCRKQPHELGIAALALLVTMPMLVATPTGFDIFEISARNSELARFIGIEEWLPMWDRRTFPESIPAFVVMGFVLLLGVRVWRIVRVEELLICGLFLIASLAVFRLTLFWALAMIPIIARWLQAAWPEQFFVMTSPWMHRRNARLILMPTAIILAILITILKLPKLDPTIPFDGVDELQRLGVRGTIYNYREWAGPLIWECYPNCRVTIDGRIYIYSKADWIAYDQAARGELSIEAIEQRYRPDAFFLRPSYHGQLMDLLDADPDWFNVYQDENCVIYLPRRFFPVKGNNELAARSPTDPLLATIPRSLAVADDRRTLEVPPRSRHLLAHRCRRTHLQ